MNKIKNIAIICMIAALYTAVSLALAPLSFGNIQCRLSEALCLLPIIYAPAVPAIVLGCFLTNLIGVFMGINALGVVDVVIGTFATGVAALLTAKFSKHRLVAAAMPVIINGLIIGLELAFLLFPENLLNGWLICGLEVAAGEAVAMVPGLFLVAALAKTKLFD